MLEQLLPVRAWSNEFCTTPLATRTQGDTIRIIAAEDFTDLTINVPVGGTVTPVIPSTGVPTLLNRGDVVEVLVDAPAHIVSERRILVMPAANSWDHDMQVNADPFLVTVPPTNAWMSSYTICTPPQEDFATTYVNVLVPAAAAGSFEINGQQVIASYTPHPCAGLLYAQVAIPPVQGMHEGHMLNAIERFSLIVYGWDRYDSYAHPGGLSFCNTPPEVLCPYKMTITEGELVPNLLLPERSQIVDDFTPYENLILEQDGPLDMLGTPQTVFPLSAGTYTVRVQATDTGSLSCSCTTILEVVSWSAAHFAAQLASPQLESSVWGPYADPDGDGLINQLVEAFGTDPNRHTRVPPFHVNQLEDGSMHITLQRRVPPSKYDYILERSSDLQTWT